MQADSQRRPNGRQTAEVLVVGAGFVGAEVARELIRRGISTRLLSRSQPLGDAVQHDETCETVVGDASDPSVVTRALEGTTHVVWALNSLMSGESESAPLSDLSLMLQPLLVLLGVLANHPQVSLTMVSSGGTVYGNPAVVPTPESAPTEPLSAYGITRLTAEKFAQRHAQLTGARVRIARLANAYGPTQSAARGQGVIAAAMQHAVNGTTLRLYGAHEIRRDFIHVEDAARHVVDYALCPDAPPIVNVGSGDAASVAEIIDMVRSASGAPLVVEHLPRRPFDVIRVQLDISVLRTFSHSTPRPLCEGISSMWNARVGSDRKSDVDAA